MTGIFTKHYDNNQVLNKVHLTIQKGQRISIRGASGIGKTTLLRLITGLETNEDTSPNDFKGLTYSFVFQEDRLIESYNAVQNIKLCAPQIQDAVIIQTLKEAGIEDTNQKVRHFSGGMKRRVAILRALFASYDILLLDEPFKGLDDDNLHKIANIINRLTIDKTLILVTHDHKDEELLNITDHIEL
ncbi:MAG: ATP-binding cassette domain-containing protein [Sphaerochaetaceae bacterium]|mgnify:FL=1|nr:ATP-binding cassette domain-containing protein [Sphaerochaetaceae bacterium]